MCSECKAVTYWFVKNYAKRAENNNFNKSKFSILPYYYGKTEVLVLANFTPETTCTVKTRLKTKPSGKWDKLKGQWCYLEGIRSQSLWQSSVRRFHIVVLTWVTSVGSLIQKVLLRMLLRFLLTAVRFELGVALYLYSSCLVVHICVALSLESFSSVVLLFK